MKRLRYIKKKMDEIHPYENNPRINDGAVDDVAESITQCGYIAPIVIDENGVILAGHTRYKALKKLGFREIDVVMAADLTEEQKRKYRLYDNKTGEVATWDLKILQRELKDIDFMDYDFGQPILEPDSDKKEEGPQYKTCPCCGEVFGI